MKLHPRILDRDSPERFSREILRKATTSAQLNEIGVDEIKKEREKRAPFQHGAHAHLHNAFGFNMQMERQ